MIGSGPRSHFHRVSVRAGAVSRPPLRWPGIADGVVWLLLLPVVVLSSLCCC